MAQSRCPLSWMKASSLQVITASQSNGGSPSLPHAVILCSDGSLQCFERTSDVSFEVMTIQRGFEEEPMCFAAEEEILYKRCIPAILGKIFIHEPVHLALIDMDLEWDHETLLQEWLDFQNESRSVVKNIWVTLRTFIAEASYELIPYSETTWHAPETKFTGQERLAVVPTTASPSNSSQSGMTAQTDQKSITFLIGAVDDIPADFDRIVWMLKHTGNQYDQGLNHKLVDLLRRQGCATTFNMANHLYPIPSPKNILSLYRKLRSVHGQMVFVPMLGFETDWLRTQSYLHLFSDQVEMNIDWTEFVRLRALRYYASQLRVTGKDRLLSSAQRCLSTTEQGLQLFDLTEDIICDLTGQAQFRLSFADVCRVYQTLVKHNTK